METVQLLMGHVRIQTTLGYARVYDGTAAKDYYRAMRLVESRLICSENNPPTSPKEMLVMIERLMKEIENTEQIKTLGKIQKGLQIIKNELFEYA